MRALFYVLLVLLISFEALAKKGKRKSRSQSLSVRSDLRIPSKYREEGVCGPLTFDGCAASQCCKLATVCYGLKKDRHCRFVCVPKPPIACLTESAGRCLDGVCKAHEENAALGGSMA